MLGSHKSGTGASTVVFYTFFTFAAMACAGTYSGGTGTGEDPYQISTINDWQELIATSADYDKHFVLLNDIDFGGINLTPVARDTNTSMSGFQGTAFSGDFDGNGHILRNAVINRPSDDGVGLFGCRNSPGQFRNLGVENIPVTGRNYVGILCGRNSRGTISNCYVTGAVSGMYECVGGLCGFNMFGQIIYCYATGTVSGIGNNVGGLVGLNHGMCTLIGCHANGSVSGTNEVGGLVGTNNNGTVTSCYATGEVTGFSNVGGLCGWGQNISQCYATGSVHGGFGVGGLCGGGIYISNCYASGDVNCIAYPTTPQYAGGLCGDGGDISHCYATGKVTGRGDFAGGLYGWNSGPVSGCFWDMETSGRTTSSGGTGKTTAQMKMLSTFAGWDFVGESANGMADVWRMCGDGIDYPRLSWEFPQGGDMDCPDGVAMEDLAYLAGRWMAGTPETVGAADGNGDGRVDLGDFVLLSEQWMK